MASLILCDRISSKTRRVRVEGVKLASKVSELKLKASKSLDIPQPTLELVYCGQILDESKNLESYDIKSGVTVHVLRKKSQDVRKAVPVDKVVVKQIVTALQTALTNPAYRNTVEQMLSKPDTLENLIAATPGLENDPVAMAMLQEPELLGLLADPSHIHKMIESHPSIGQAAMMVASAVNEEGAKASGGSHGNHSARSTYSLDEMSDDEEMPLARGPPAPITASQLAAALASAGGSSTTSPPGQSTSAASSQNTPAASASADNITADFFRQALLSAAGQTPPQTSQQHVVTDAQLTQMRDMGITDESVARRALEASGGDIQAALEIIFGDGGGF